ncbi:MAG: hypothetical protein ABR517_08970 [Thermoanaerobaculia bacterium]
MTSIRSALLSVLIALAIGTFAPRAEAQPLQSPSTQVYEDAKVIRRVAEVSRRDMPRNVLDALIQQSLDALRGKSGDLEYRYATWQRVESGRKQESSAITPGAEESLSEVRIKDQLAYRLRVEIPKRRMLFFGNDRVWVDRIEARYTPIGGQPQVLSVPVNEWFESGSERVWDLPDVAREAEVSVFARPESEKSSIVLTLSRASLVDNPDSPYYEVVRRLKSTDDAVRDRDYRKVRNLQDEIIALLEGEVGGRAVTPLPPVSSSTGSIGTPPRPLGPAPTGDDVYFELGHIRELLNGNDDDRREAIFRLERLIERTKPKI